MDAISKAVGEMNERLYGPRYCQNCKQVRDVQTFKLVGSDYTEFKDGVLTLGFEGSHVCNTCFHTIKDAAPSPQPEKEK